MDRFRKRLEDFRLKVREFIKYNWHNEPEGDKFRSWDVWLTVGAVRHKPAKKWQRICWNAYGVVSICSFLIIVLNAKEDIQGEFNMTKAAWHATVILATGLGFVKDSILNHHYESIQTARDFINSKPFSSGDSVIQMNNDSARRKKCFQRLQLAALALLLINLIDQTVINAPIPEIDELLGTPQVLQYFGPIPAKGLRFLYFFTFVPIWINKYCAVTGIICFLLYGFSIEYDILVRGFDDILDNVYSDVEEEFPSTARATPEWKRFKRDQLYWKYLKQRVNGQVKLHVQFVKNLQLLVPVVKILFGVIYYNAMVCFSPAIYVLVTNGLSGATPFLVSGINVQLLECYLWCRIIDSLKENNEKLELKILDLTSRIPHSQFHHKKYAEMRTTLCIMKTFVRNHEPFSCFGVFPISVEAFTELLHIGYTVFAFLRDMEKKDLTTRRRMKQKKQKY